MSFITDLLFGGGDAADAAIEASEVAASADREALEYLKQRERLPIQMRDQALQGLAAAYLPSGGSQPTAAYPQPAAYQQTYGGYGGGPPFTSVGPGGQQRGWNEQAYLEANPDVAKAVNEGWMESGFAHYQKHGREEGRAPGQYAQQPVTIDGQAGPAEEGLSPDWIYERAAGSGLYEGLAAKSQEDLVAEAMSSPLYAAIMSGRGAGEESILRNRSATGGLRSGGTIESLAEYNTNLQNRALLTGYEEAVRRGDVDRRALLTSFSDVRGGLGGLAGLQGEEQGIANLYSSIGGKTAAGITGAAQASQDALGTGIETALGVGNMLAMAGVFSDIRMKKNIRFVEERFGHNWYEWEWNEVGELMGLEGTETGVLAHEVYEKQPDAVHEIGGYLAIDYARLVETTLEAA